MDRYVDTLTVRTPGRADEVLAAALERGINLWRADEDTVLLSLDELTTEDDLRAVAAAFGADPDSVTVDEDTAPDHGDLARREDEAYLTHPVFTSHRSETAMLRYLRTLADKDYALDRGMIPLGSCTMKLNPTTTMEAVTWPEFGSLHPFAPADQSRGYRELIDQLCGWLEEITGYDRVSLQPNAGAQGEFAGLLAIRKYHLDRGDDQRTICLIPASAHGTNAASAVMAGLKVVVVKSTGSGEVDLDDLRAKIETHGDQLAAIMVTYPSTHGVYEDTITELCELVHEAGGQVYVDGANLNALLGIAKPGEFGGDVSHLNLHKTFTIRTAVEAPASARSGCGSTSRPISPTTRWTRRPGPRAGPGPSPRRPSGRPASCRSPGPTSG